MCAGNLDCIKNKDNSMQAIRAAKRKVEDLSTN